MSSTPNKRRDEIVRELETWYFGCLFSDWTKQTEVGEWRDIVNQACWRLAALEAENAKLTGQVARLGKLSIPRSPTEDGKPSVEALVDDVCAHIKSLTDEVERVGMGYDRLTAERDDMIKRIDELIEVVEHKDGCVIALEKERDEAREYAKDGHGKCIELRDAQAATIETLKRRLVMEADQCGCSCGKMPGENETHADGCSTGHAKEVE